MNFSIMKYKWVSLGGSLLALVITLYLTYALYGGFNRGIDFAGGIKLELASNEKLTVEKLREFLANKNINAQVFGSERDGKPTIKIEISGPVEQLLTKEAEKNKQKLEELGLSVNSVDYLTMVISEELLAKDRFSLNILHADQVGPTIGRYLTMAAIKVLAVALLLITVYVAFRFKLNFAFGALIASLHDLLITVGFIGVMQIPLSIPVIAALLTILGYSINDTIVIFDRIRENLHGQEELGIDKVVDKSIWQSLSRTINTTATTILAIFPIYLFGGDTLRDLALVLIIGILIGTYSSNFVAAPVVVIWDNFAKKRA